MSLQVLCTAENHRYYDEIVYTEGKHVLVGGGTDGASVNIANHNGMKSMMLDSHPWLVWSWCYAHQLELAC